MMHSSKVIFLSLLFYVSVAFTSNADDVFLLSATSSSENGNLSLDLEFSHDVSVSTADVKFLKRTIEWDLKGVFLKKDKIFLDVSKNDVSNLYASQNNAKNTRVRINLESNKIASNYHDRLIFQRQGKHILIKFDGSQPLISNNITELNRIYDINRLPSGESKLLGKLQEEATLKISASDLPPTNEGKSGESEENKSESEIPLVAASEKTKEASSSPWMRILAGIGILCGLLLSVVIVGRKIQEKRTGAAFNHESIKVISQKYLGPKRCLTLIRVSGEYLLLGVTDHNITLVKSLSVINDELPQLEPKDFGSTIKGMQQQIEGDDGAMATESEIEDKFTISSLGDVKKILKKKKYIDEMDV